MTLDDDQPQHSLGTDYFEHVIFCTLKEYANFYDGLSDHVMMWASQGTTAILNRDTYVYSSMHGTLESIHDTLIKGRINDAYALLRKYYDSTIINIYSNLYLEENCTLDNLIVTKIDNWLKGKERLPEYRVMSQYIKKSLRVEAITSLLAADESYKNIRGRCCNDHTHYNFYKNVLLNDNTIYLKNRVRVLDIFAKDLEAIFIQHFAYLFYLKDRYMMASDYRDCREMDIEPEEGSQYFVANFIQEIFNKIIKTKRPDLATEMKGKTSMQLE